TVFVLPSLTTLSSSCAILSPLLISLFFLFPHPATTDIYTLSLHDALPISLRIQPADGDLAGVERAQSLENFYSGGFARAIRAEQAKDLAFFNGKAHAAHGFHFAVALDEVLHSKDGIRHFLAPTTRG